MNISPVDWIIVVLYLVGVVGLGCWAGTNARKRGRNKGESEAGDYFMAAHTLKWPVIGVALFATDISCVHLISLAQSGYDTGLLYGNFQWMAAFTLILLGFFFVPFYLKSKVTTLPDFLEKRYGRQCRDCLAFVSIIAAIIFHIAFPLATGWLILHDIFGIEKWTCILVMCGLTGIYTVTGGLAAVALTETIQTFVLLIGACVITWFAWHKTGGWHGMTASFDTAPGTADGKLLSMLRPHGDDSGMSWYAVFLGYPVLGIWYWCADQTIVQRVLGARSENDARVGSIFCGLIKILPVFIFLVPGLMLYTAVKQGNIEGVSQVRVMSTSTGADGKKERRIAITGQGHTSETVVVKEGDTLDLSQYSVSTSGNAPALIIGPGVPAKADALGVIMVPAGVKGYESKEVYAVMIRKLLPTGVLGVLAAALMAALMGNLSSASNSIATMVSYDVVKRFRPNTGDKALVLIGRIATLVAILSGVALVPLFDLYESLFVAINEIITHLAPPITSVFVLGVFWPRASARGAKWTMWLGLLMGVSVFALKTFHVWKPETFSWVPAFFYKTSFMMMAFYMCAACVVMQIVLTLLLPKLPAEDPQKLFWRHPLEALEAPGWRGILNYKVLAAIVVAAMTTLYVIFR